MTYFIYLCFPIDIVCIVFIQGNQPFNPSAIKSQFLHVFIIVHYEILDDKKCWRVEIVSVKDVPNFGPPLPEHSAVFYDPKELEQFLLAKCKLLHAIKKIKYSFFYM
jgi:hypothetical protein